MRLDDIARQLRFRLEGNGDMEVRRPRYAGEAGMEDLAVARTVREARLTLAKAVLMGDGLVRGKTLLRISGLPQNCDLAIAIALVAGLFVQAGEAPDHDRMSLWRDLEDYPGVLAGESVTIGAGTSIGPHTTIGRDVRIGQGVRIAPGVTIGSGVRIGDYVSVESGARVGDAAFFHYELNGRQHVFTGIGGTRIGEGSAIGANSVIQRGTLSDTIIGKGVAIGSLVVIGHDAHIGDNCLIVSQAGISGQVAFGDCAAIFGQAGVAERVRVGSGSVIMAKSAVIKDVPAGEVISGPYNRRHGEELRLRARLERLAAEMSAGKRRTRR